MGEHGGKAPLSAGPWPKAIPKGAKCRMTHMPKRYWGCMTEFQTDGTGPALPAGEP